MDEERSEITPNRQNYVPVTDPEEAEMYELSEKEFKVAVKVNKYQYDKEIFFTLPCSMQHYSQ